MGRFRGNIISQKTANHAIVFHHTLLDECGLSNVNVFQLKDLVNSEQTKYQALLNTTNVNFPGDFPDPFDWLSQRWRCSQWYYEEASEGGFTTVNISTSELLNLLKFHELSDEEQEQDANKSTYRKKISRIQTSRINSVRSVDATESSQEALYIMGYAFLYHVRIYFLNRKSQSNQRSLGSKTTNMFVGTPRRPSGATYSASASREESTGVFARGGIEGSEEPQDQVAGPLLTVWNDNLGGFQTPGPFLARLLEDIDSANIPMINLDSSNTLDRDPADFMSGANSSSNATYGYAAPFSVHGGNPKAFGPNLDKCQDKNNVEKIQVVNRSNTTFNSGEVVLVYPIDGEFIIGKYSPLETTEIPLNLGRIGFYQFIANSDELFRPKVFADDDSKNSTSYILPDDLLNIVRWKTYGTSQDNKSNGVKAIPDWHKGVELNPYFQIYPGDIPKPPTINCFTFENPAERGTGAVSQDIPVWWGPVFTEGVSAGPWGDGYVGAVVDSRTNTVVSNATVDLPDINDFDGFNFPAATATNGPFGVGFPSEDCYGFIKHFNSASWPLYSPILNGCSHIAISGTSPDDTFYPTEAAYNLAPANPNNIIFQLCPAEYVGLADEGSDSGTVAAGSPNRLDNTAFNCRKLKESAIQFFQNKAGFAPSQDLPRAAIQRRNIAMNDTAGIIDDFSARVQRDIAGNQSGNHYFYNKNASVNSFLCFPYDAYARFSALNRPRNTNTLWGGDGALDSTTDNQNYITSRIGANTVGITVMRRKFAQGGRTGATLSINTEGLFGVRGRQFGLAPSTTFTASIIGSIMASIIGTTTADTRGLTSGYGSTTGDSYYGFGSAGVYVRIYDAWPDQDTIAVPQYFTLLHLNPRTFFGLNSDGSLKTEFDNPVPDVGFSRVDVKQTLKDVRFYRLNGDSVDWEDLTIAVDIPDQDLPDSIKERGSTDYLNFYEPTYAGHISVPDPDDPQKNIRYRSNTAEEGLLASAGDIITSGTFLRPTDEWRMNTSRRGALVSGGGFTYGKKVIGVEESSGSVLSPGTNFNIGDVFTLRNQIQIKVSQITGDGGIQEFEINKTDFEASNETKIKQSEAGEGITPGDLPLILSISPKSAGEFAEISFTQGVVYERLGIDVGPKSLAGPTRLTLGSGEGKTWTEGRRDSTISVTPTDGTRYQGQFEAMFFAQNDITMATMREQGPTTGTPRLQFFRIDMA